MTAHNIFTAGFFLLLGGTLGFALALHMVRESVTAIHRRYIKVKEAADEMQELIARQAEDRLYFQEKFQEKFNDNKDKENNNENE